MSRRTVSMLLIAAACLPLASCQIAPAPIAAPATYAPALGVAVANPARSAENRARDAYRHPVETLSFFGVRPTDTVVEIWPGGGWYTEILAPYLAAGGGRLIAASPGWGMAGFEKMRASKEALVGTAVAAEFPVFDGKPAAIAPNSADVVLTFRNVHNWRMGYRRDDKADYAPEAFRQMYAMLKPGGVLGIVDHRLPEGADPGRERDSGYIKTSTVVALAQAAGFRLAGTSEINANPKDTADHPEGVWTLPPSYALKDKDRARYAAIGESDRMTLKFVKPL